MSYEIYNPSGDLVQGRNHNLSILEPLSVWINSSIKHNLAGYIDLTNTDLDLNLSVRDNDLDLYNGSGGSSMDNIPEEWMDDVLKDFKRSLYTYEEPRTIVLIGIYAVIFLMALIGNVMVLLVMVANHTMRNVTNYFLLNLALSDLLGKSGIG